MENQELFLPVSINNVPDYSRFCDEETSIFRKTINSKIQEPTGDLKYDTAPMDQPTDQIQSGTGGCYGSGLRPGMGIVPGGMMTPGGGLKPGGGRKRSHDIIVTTGSKGYCGKSGGGKSEPGIANIAGQIRGQAVQFTHAHDPAHRLRVQPMMKY